MKKLLLGFAAAMSLLATDAVADGMARKSAAYTEAAAPSWTGFYVGAGIGSGAVVHDLEVNVPGANLLSFDGIGGEGIFGTVIVGYDRKVTHNIVAGVFFDYDFSNISTDLSVPGIFNASLEHMYSWSVGARVGMLTSPSTLWYGTAGYTQAEFDFSSNPAFALNVPRFKGYFVGGGVESQLRDGWALRAEYRFTQYDSESVFNTGPGGIDVTLEPSMHTARVALTYKFGRRDEEPVPLK
jgi:outer membrane immunogenic protein